MRRMKESLDGIGEEVNDLFQSGMMEEEGMSVSRINRDFRGVID